MRILISLLIAQFVMALAFSMSLPLLSFVAIELNASAASTSWILGSNAFVFIFLTYFLGYLSDFLGRKLVITIAWFIAAISFAILGPLPTLLGVALSRFLGGTHGAASTVVMAYVGDITETDKEKTAAIMGYIGSAVSLGWIIGPALMIFFIIDDLDSAINLLTYLGYLAIIAWGGLVIALYSFDGQTTVKQSEKSPDKPAQKKAWSFLSNKTSRLLLVASTFLFLCYSGTNASMTAILQTEYQVGLSFVARIYVVASIVAFVSEVWLIKYLSLGSRIAKLCYMLFAAIILLLTLQLISSEFNKFLLPTYFVVLSFGIAVIYPVTMSWFSTTTNEANRGAVTGAVGSVITAGQVMGPFLVGAGQMLSERGFSLAQLGFAILCLFSLTAFRLLKTDRNENE